MKRKNMLKRVLLLTLSLLLVAMTLVSCGGGEAELDSVKKAADGEGCRHYFARILTQEVSTAYTAREAFVAASRGYNMLAEGFNDELVGTESDPKDPAAEPFVDADGNSYLVSMAGAKAALNLIKPQTDSVGDVTVFENDLASMTAEDVVAIVKMMRNIKVDTAGNSFPGVILEWVGVFLGALTTLTGGYYVWALFFFALVVELLLLYFGIKQQKTSIKQAKLRPKEMAIRKKYAGRTDQKSQQALQQELQKFYQEEGVSPFGGCLPLLIQMPIIIALYNIVINPLQYVLGKGEGVVNALLKFATTSRAAGGLGVSVAESTNGTIGLLSRIDAGKLATIKDFAWFENGGEVADALADVTVESLPNFSLFGLNAGSTPSFTPTASIDYLLLLIPVLTFVAYFFSMKLNRKFSYQPQMMAENAQAGCSNNMMDIMMPLMSVYITFITPAAVGIYWIFKCIISTLKQFLLHKAMPLPVFTEEDYKRAEREMKGKLRPEERAPLPGRAAGAKRSLHHIDDEDDLPTRVRAQSDDEEEDTIYDRRAREAAQKAAAATPDEKGKAKGLGGAKVKDDRKNNKKK